MRFMTWGYMSLAAGLFVGLATLAHSDATINYLQGWDYKNPYHPSPYPPTFHHHPHRIATSAVIVNTPSVYYAGDIAPIAPPPVDLGSIDQKIHEQRLLLSNKLNQNLISQESYDEENAYLTQLQNRAYDEAAANGGTLTFAQESALSDQLQHVANEIDHNLQN